MGLYSVILVRGTFARASWPLLDERLSALALFGLITASLGCWLVNAQPAKPPPKEF